MRRRAHHGWARRLATVVTLSVLGLTAVGTATSSAAAAGPGPGYRRACGIPGPRRAACLVLVRTNVPQRSQASLGRGTPPAGFGFGPASLQNAYVLPSSSAGTGETVAVVDAYDDPKAESDLAAYRSDWGLPPCTTASGCFSKVNQDGQAGPVSWGGGGRGGGEGEASDLDMVSAICPNCHILLVEGNTASVADLGTAVNGAVSLGAKFVSNSYGAAEYASETSDDSSYYNHPGVVVTASAGDSGYGAQFPAASPAVVAVGGTSLTQAANARGWSETTWSGTGSGCSAYEPKPGWQADTGCANRTATDVSAVADPNTGVAVYDTYDRGGWLEVGGTSVSAPIIASSYALVGPPAPGTYPAGYLYAHAADLNDVTSGSNGTCNPGYLCTASQGYDGPTGLGTPEGISAFGKPAGNIVTVASPGDQSEIQDVAFRLQVHALDSDSGQTLAYSAAGLPAGLSIDAPTGVISGTPTTVGSSAVKVTATDGTGAAGSATFTLAVTGPVSFHGPGPQASYLGQPVVLPAPASDAVPGRTMTYSASGLPAGLSVSTATGTVTGLLAASGYYHPVVTALDSAGRSGTDTFVWQVSTAQAAGRTGHVRLGRGRMCLAALASTASGNPVRLWPCHGSRGQMWTVAPNGSVHVLGKCLAMAGGAAPQVASCSHAAAQQWRIGPRGELVNPGSGECLAVPSGSAKGTRVTIRRCTGAAGQRWITPPGPLVSGVTGQCADSGRGTTGYPQVWDCGNTRAQAWTLQPNGTLQVGGRCLAVPGGATASGTRAGLVTCTGTGGQQWRPGRGGTLVNRASGKCLDAPGASASAGTRLVISRCRTVPGELWHLE